MRPKLFGDFGADVIKVERPDEGSLTRQGRREHPVRLRQRQAEWTAGQDPAELVERPQQRRVAVGEVLTEPQLLADEHLWARHWFQRRSHPATGSHDRVRGRRADIGRAVRMARGPVV
jgi:crotonobetainyl-CoA:carnitine CoA-transferase CaiB-like acyl-CoA transferase